MYCGNVLTFCTTLPQPSRRHLLCLFYIWKAFNLRKNKKHPLSLHRLNSDQVKWFLRSTVASIHHKLELFRLVPPSFSPLPRLSFLSVRSRKKKATGAHLHAERLGSSCEQGIEMEMGRGERVDYAPQTCALPPGWPTSWVERGKRNMGRRVGGGAGTRGGETHVGSRVRQQQIKGQERMRRSGKSFWPTEDRETRRVKQYRLEELMGWK